ncbi:MAG: hypothetical protein B7Z75_12630 [Acidocella sp. 20-57-95]|nr:MAG: hypothetical protein B7Z75_12630 [Acidocella sp. 20-57-95]OYV62126.1 MAG: hypothetical protein B7Z71_02400 [Acidocella sp. 21-58-7]HQT65431.1 OmpA family protein [Acidocella sp.]HQU03397.1 OmpA family protein [Acidocella sp.]
MIEAFLLSKIRVSRGVAVLMVAVVLSGCSGTVGMYHDVQGGAIAQPRQAPPGADLPYPNLASVPEEPKPLTAAQQAALQARLHQDSPEIAATKANPAALAGLVLPSAPPPVPAVPGVSEPVSSGLTEAAKPTPPAEKPQSPPSVPVAIAFEPGSAILHAEMLKTLQRAVADRGDARILVGGFGEQTGGPDGQALILAVHRARAIADALTATGLSPTIIEMKAAAVGSGGFVQLVY